MPKTILDRYNDAGDAGKLGSSSIPTRPLKKVHLVPVWDTDNNVGRVVKASDLLTDNPAFVMTMVMSGAYSIVLGTAVYDEETPPNLVSAEIQWADGTAGTIEREITDGNGSTEDTFSRIIPGATPQWYKHTTLYDVDGTVKGGGFMAARDGLPVLTVTETLLPFVVYEGDTPDLGETNTGIQAIKLKTINTEELVKVVPPSGWKVSSDEGVHWKDELSLDCSDSGVTIWVRLKETVVGAYAGTLSVSVGVAYQEISLSGHILEVEIILDGTLSAFSTTQGTPSEAQSYSVAGAGLKESIYVEAPAGYELSIDGEDWLSTLMLSPDYDGYVYVRLDGTAAGNYSVDIEHSAEEGVTPQNLAVSGEVIGAQQVATPAIVPDEVTSGKFTITCATEGAAIYYTTDGETPTEDDTPYEEAVTLEATATVKAKAFKTGWVPSEVASRTVTVTLFTAIGGQVVEIGDYRYHIFDYGTDTLSISAGSADIDYMLIGGGASGGSGQTAGAAGGGGGAGGIVSGTLTGVDSDITLSVGAGGAAKTGYNEGNAGGDTTLTLGETTITAKGGGGGGVSGKAGQPGGSGGGAGGRGAGDPGTTGGAALQTTPATEGYDAGYGNAGGNRVATYIATNGAGGGGAGGAGGNCSTELGAGAGGAAKAMADFANVLVWNQSANYAAGGSGGTAGANGLGGLSATAHGLNGTGSGAGGSKSNQPGIGNGGSGIAILRYAKDGAADAEYQNVRLYIDGDGYLWVRSQFDSSYDSLLKYDTGPSVGVLPYYEYLIPITNPPLDFTTGAVAAKNSGDDAAPVGIAGTSTGTGHGAQIVTLMVKAEGHGLVAADIGSVWEDSAEAEFVLCAIKSATEASFIAKAYSGTELWHAATATASSLKLTCGVASVTFDSQSCVYMTEAAAGILAYTTPAKTWQLADETDIEAETLYRCTSASFRTVTQHINPISFRDWCEANAGTFTENPTQAQIDAVDITKILELNYCYQFHDHGSVEITNSVKFLQDANGGGTIGAGAAAIAGSTLKFYAPGIKDSVTGFNRTIKTYALASDWAPSTTADLVDAAEPINRIVMFCDDATKYCYSHGIDTTYGDGTATARLAGNLGYWWSVVKTTRKSLGRITVSSSKNVNDTVQYRVYRKLFKPGGYGTASFVYWVVMGGYYYIYIDYHATADENITLPAYLFGGKTYTIHEQQGTWTTPATGGTIGADGTLAVNVTDWGHTILKVSAT